MTKNKVDMADICELAHTLTVKECLRLGYHIDTMKNGESAYTSKSQPIFDGYYDLITNTLNV
jgi:hypothetical protein